MTDRIYGENFDLAVANEKLRLLAEDRKDAMTALLTALAALEQQMRAADKPNLAVAMADKEWADQIQALRTAHGETESRP